jgi:alginate O-acetyltransferase complex protein AlgJ
MKVSKILFICIIALIMLTLPLASLFDESKKRNIEFIKQFEMRDSFTWGNIKSSSNKIQAFEDYFNDSMPFKYQLVTTYCNALHSIDVSVFKDKVIYGKNNYIFLGVPKYENLHRGQIASNRTDVQKTIYNIDILNDYFTQKDIAFVYFVAPDKASIYSEYLPSWYTTTSLDTPITAMRNLIQQNDIYDYTLDFEQALLNAKLDYSDLLYGKTDTHYTSLGAYICYNKIIDYINASYNMEIEKLQLESVESLDKTEGYSFKHMAGLDKKVEDFETILTFKNANYFSELSDYEIEVEVFVNEYALNDKKVLFIGDSFRGQQEPLFVQTFEYNEFINISKLNELSESSAIVELVNEINPDIVIVERVERSSFISAGKYNYHKASILKEIYDNSVNFIEIDLLDTEKVSIQNISNIYINEGFVHIQPSTSDPIIILEDINTTNNKIVIKSEIEVSSDCSFQVYYKSDGSDFEEQYSVIDPLKKGVNEVYTLINSDTSIDSIRFDVNDENCFSVNNFNLKLLN